MVIAFMKLSPAHHAYNRTLDGGEYNGYVAFDVELPSELDGKVWVHGGITFDRKMSEVMPTPIIPLTEIPHPDELKKFRVIGFDTLHDDDTKEKWTFERVKEETLDMKKQIEVLIKYSNK